MYLRGSAMMALVRAICSTLGGIHRQGEILQHGGAVHMAEPTAPEHILAGIDGDAHQPGFLAGLSVKLIHPAIRLEEGLLHRVAGEVDIL